jgi:hypothetical protein
LLQDVFNRWYEYVLFLRVPYSAVEHDCQKRFMKAVGLLRYFLPAGTRLTRSPPMENLVQYATRKGCMEGTAGAVVEAANDSCMAHKAKIGAVPAEGAHSLAAPKKKRRRMYKEAFEGMFKHLNVLYTNHGDIFPAYRYPDIVDVAFTDADDAVRVAM